MFWVYPTFVEIWVRLKMETETGNVHLLKGATDTPHHFIYSLRVGGSSLNSRFTFRCSLSHQVGSCSKQWTVFLNTAAKEICNWQITLYWSTSYWILQRIHHNTSFVHCALEVVRRIVGPVSVAVLVTMYVPVLNSEQCSWTLQLKRYAVGK
jgi:hypothetical protein